MKYTFQNVVKTSIKLDLMSSLSSLQYQIHHNLQIQPMLVNLFHLRRFLTYFAVFHNSLLQILQSEVQQFFAFFVGLFNFTLKSPHKF